MSVKEWEKKVLEAPGASERVSEIEEELRLAATLTALREQAGLSQRELAERLGVRQPRVAAIEKSRNITIEVLERYVDALGGKLQITVVKGNRRISLMGAPTSSRTRASGRADPSRKEAVRTPEPVPTRRGRKSA